MTIRGRTCELGIARAAAHYEKAGRARIKKQATGMRKTATGWVHSAAAPIDFRGHVKGSAVCVEAKEHGGSSFPLNESTLTSRQIDELSGERADGAQCTLVVDLPDQGETYAVDWLEVERFLAAPYRASLSLQWLRAFGQLCKVTGRGTGDFRVWFLDLVAHPARETAYLAEAAERAAKPVVQLYETTRAPAQQQLVSTRPDKKTDPDGYTRHIGALMQEGLERQMGAKKRTYGRGGKRG